MHFMHILMILFLCLLVSILQCDADHLPNYKARSSVKNNDFRKLDEKKPKVLNQGEYHHKMYNAFNKSYAGGGHKHPKAWMVLDEVNGLKNEDIVMLVTTTAVKNWFYIRSRIIQSARTWMRMLANVFVIIEDNFQTRYAMRHCKKTEYTRFTTFDCHNEPTYLLSRNCTSQYYGAAGPCCKVDEIMSFITLDKPELFAHTKYVLHCDDDTYFRVDQMMKWLAAIENSGMNTFPIITTGNVEKYSVLEGMWGLKGGCKEIHPNGWFQPMMINHAAMERMKQAHSVYGLTDTCRNFGVTHDVGMGPQAIFIHALKHMGATDNCTDNNDYDQKMSIGCGDINRPYLGHTPSKDYKTNANMYDAWEYYRLYGEESDYDHVHATLIWSTKNVTLYPNGTMLPGISTTGDENKVKIKHVLTVNDTIAADGTFDGLKVVERYVPHINPFLGYETTKHSKQYNVVQEWHEFKLTDCNEPGIK